MGFYEDMVKMLIRTVRLQLFSMDPRTDVTIKPEMQWLLETLMTCPGLFLDSINPEMLERKILAYLNELTRNMRQRREESVLGNCLEILVREAPLLDDSLRVKALTFMETLMTWPGLFLESINPEMIERLTLEYLEELIRNISQQ